MAKKKKKAKRKVPTTRGLTPKQRKKVESATRGKGAVGLAAKKAQLRANERVRGDVRLIASALRGGQLGFQGPRVGRGAPTPATRPPRRITVTEPTVVTGTAKKKKKSKKKPKAKRR